MIKIEKDQYYLMKNGRIAGPMDWDALRDCWTDNYRDWRHDGTIIDSTKYAHKFNLVAQVVVTRPDPHGARPEFRELPQQTPEKANEFREKIGMPPLPDHISETGKKVSDKAAFCRETAAKFYVELIRHDGYKDCSPGELAEIAVEMTDKLVECLGE